MIELYKHQETALSYLRINDSFALFMEQGTGKTLVVLFRLLELLKSGNIKDALIVGPKSALGAWDRDIELFSLEDQQILKDSITIINYDKIWAYKKRTIHHRNGTTSENRKLVVNEKYIKPQYDAIVVDEAHAIKNRTSNRSEILLKMSVNAKYRYILTGTPISNGKLESIWSLFCFLDPYIQNGYPYSKIFNGSYGVFLDRYCICNMYHKPYSYIHIKELQEIIREYSFRIKKSECLDLPEKLPDEIIKVDLLEKKLYKKMAETSASLEYEILASNPLSRLLKLRQIASGFITDELGQTIELKTEKIQALTEIIEGYEDDKKLVIFAEFKHSIKAISELLDKLKIKYVVLDGDQKDKNIWRKFQSDKTIRVIVCQYQTANAGIDLFSSDTIIYYEPTLRSEILEQSRDRIHRSGQTQKCSYIHLLAKGTVEVDIYRALSGYADFSEDLFNRYMDMYRRSFK